MKRVSGSKASRRLRQGPAAARLPRAAASPAPHPCWPAGRCPCSGSDCSPRGSLAAAARAAACPGATARGCRPRCWSGLGWAPACRRRRCPRRPRRRRRHRAAAAPADRPPQSWSRCEGCWLRLSAGWSPGGAGGFSVGPCAATPALAVPARACRSDAELEELVGWENVSKARATNTLWARSHQPLRLPVCQQITSAAVITGRSLQVWRAARSAAPSGAGGAAGAAPAPYSPRR